METVRIEQQLVRCKGLWDQREQQRTLDKELQDLQEKATQTSVDKQKLLEKRRQEGLQAEREKREQAQRIEQMVAEEKRRLAASLQAITATEVPREEGRRTRAPKTHGVRVSRRVNHVEEDEIVESSSSDTDDNGELSDGEVAAMHRDVFGGDSESEDEDSEPTKSNQDHNPKKRVRAVESSDDESEGEKRPRIEKESPINKKSMVSDDESQPDEANHLDEPTKEDEVVKEVNDLFGDEDSDSFVCQKTRYKAHYDYLRQRLKESPPQAAIIRIRRITITNTTIRAVTRAFCHHILFFRLRVSEWKIKAC